MMKVYWTLPLVLVLALGCAGNKPETTTTTTTSTSSSDPQNGTVATGTSVEAEKPVAPPSNELQNDAYAYYGLNNTKPMEMEIKFSNGIAPLNGTQTIKPLGEKDGKALFKVERSGGLQALGAVTLSLRKDGIYVESMDEGTLPKPTLELPAKLTTGTTWSNNSEFTLQGHKMKDKSDWKVIGPKKIKTKAGDFDAMLVQGTGTLVQDDEKSSTVTKVWFVKDVGSVKMEIQKTVGSQVTTVTAETTSLGQSKP